MEEVDPGLGPGRLAGEFHLDEAFEQWPELASGLDQRPCVRAQQVRGDTRSSTNASFAVPIARLLRFLDQAGDALDQEDLFQEAYVPECCRLRDPGLVAHAGGHQKLAAACGEQPDQGAHLCRPLDVGELSDISRNQVRDVGIQQMFLAPGVGAGDCLGEASADDPFRVFGAANLGLVPKFFALGKDGVDEAVRCLVDLTLREPARVRSSPFARAGCQAAREGLGHAPSR